jgi:transposase
MKCKRSSDGRKLDHHTLQVMRQQAVKAAREGATVASIATAFGVSTRTVFSWLAQFAEGGQNALLAKPIPGRPPKISADEMRWIAQAVRDNSPQQFKFEFGLWTLSLISELIKRQFGKSLALASVSRVMKLLGFSAQKPLYQAWQQDTRLVHEWETKTYPAIKAQARAQGATIYFADEAGIRSDYHTGTTWAPVGQTPVVEVTGRRFSFNMISAVSPRGEFRFMIHEGSVTATTFKEFLTRLMVGASKPIFLIVDGHPIHKSKLVKDYVASLNGQLTLFYLPPYAPQLNPDEQVWAHVKRQVSRQLVQSLDDMKSLALGALRRIQKLPDLVKSFFRQPECQYASE